MSWMHSVFTISSFPNVMPEMVDVFLRRGLIQYGRSAWHMAPVSVKQWFHSPLVTWAVLAAVLGIFEANEAYFTAHKDTTAERGCQSALSIVLPRLEALEAQICTQIPSI
jgi:hypothetical protein